MDGNAKSQKIAVVDDSATSLAYSAEVLTQAGYEVRTFKDIWIAQEMFEMRPDLILMDVRMGSTSGTSAVKALVGRSFTKSTVIVLHSSLKNWELDLLAPRCGAHGYIHKTDNPEDLLRKVRFFLRASQSAKDAESLNRDL